MFLQCQQRTTNLHATDELICTMHYTVYVRSVLLGWWFATCCYEHHHLYHDSLHNFFISTL